MQVTPFGLEHPTQYFIESRRLRGGATVKPEQVGSACAGGEEEREVAEETMDMSAQDFDSFINDGDTMQ